MMIEVWKTDRLGNKSAEAMLSIIVSYDKYDVLAERAMWRGYYWLGEVRAEDAILEKTVSEAKLSILTEVCKVIRNNTPQPHNTYKKIALLDTIWETAKEGYDKEIKLRSLDLCLEVSRDRSESYTHKVIHNHKRVYASHEKYGTLQQAMRHCLIEAEGMLRFAKSKI